MDKLSGILGFSGINSASISTADAFESFASVYSDDIVDFSGTDAARSFSGNYVACLEDSERDELENINLWEEDAGISEKEAEAAVKRSAEDSKDAAEAQAKAKACDDEIDKIAAEGEIEGKEAVTEETLEEFTTELDELEKEREMKLKEQEELEAKQAQLVEDIAEAKANGDDAKAAELSAELSTVNQKLDNLNNEIKAADNKINDVRNSINSAKNQLEQQINDKQNAQQDKLNAANQAKQDASAEAQRAGAQAQQSKQASSEADKNLQKLQTEAQQARSDADSKAKAAAQADADVESAQAELAGAQSKTITKTDENGNETQVPDEAAISAAQANLEAKESAAASAHAEADAAEAEASGKERELAAAQAEAKAAENAAKSDTKAAEDASARAKKADSAADKAAVNNNQSKNNAAEAQSAAQNSGSSGSGASGSSGSGNRGTGSVSGAGRTGSTGSSGRLSSTSGANAASASADGGNSVADRTGVLESAVNVDFSSCSSEEAASGIESYAESQGYSMPAGFGREFVKACDEAGLDYGTALAVCQANDFGRSGGGLFGLTADKNGRSQDSWKSELSEGASKLASMRDSGGSGSGKTVYDQLSAIGSELGISDYADKAYSDYVQKISPYMLENVNGAATDYQRLMDDINACGSCRAIQSGDRDDNLYKVIASKQGMSTEEAEAYVSERLAAVREKYGNSRDTAVLSGLTLIDIAAQNGVKLRYGASSARGTAAGIDPAVTSDCRNWFSWGTNQGTEGDVPSWNVGQVIKGYEGGPENVVRTSDYSQLLPGDAVGRGSDHITMVVANDPEAKTITVSEASGHSAGIQLRTMSYKKAAELNYTGTLMGSYYH